MSIFATANECASSGLVWLEILATTSFPLFASPMDIASMQVTASFPRSALIPNHVWRKCLSMSFPCLAADSSCYGVPQRRDLMHCCWPLRRAIHAKGSGLMIRNSVEAKQLAKLLQGMEKTCSKHHTQGDGHVGGILVGRFKMVEADASSNLEWPATVFELPSGLHEGLGSLNSAVPIRMALGPDCILLEVGVQQASRTHGHTGNRSMIMDIKAACADGSLNYQRVKVRADGRRWRGAAGLHVFPKFKKSSQVDSVEVLCAIFLRDGERKEWTADLFGALHLCS